MNRTLTSLLPTTTFTLLLAAAPAQNDDGAYWNEYALPAGFTSVQGLGSQVLIQTPTDFHFYSGQHRRWTVQPVTSPTIVGVANKHTVWRDGSTVYGFSTYTARVEPLATTGSATVSIGSASSSWTAYVLDGNTVWAWSAFFGEWKPLTVTGAPTVGIGSHVVTSNDGNQVAAFSAFYGDWVVLNRSGATTTFTWRNGMFASFGGPDEVAAFSAYTNAWASTPFPINGISYDGRDAYASALGNGGSDRLWFSALHGTFTPSSWPNGATTQFGPSVAVVTDTSGQVFGYSPGAGTLVPIATGPQPAITVATGSFGACAVLDDGQSLQAFSGLTGTVAATPFYVPATLTVGDTEAFATGPGTIGFAYSAIRGQWVQAPAVTASATTANFECILRTVPGGYEAFSARTGTFAPLASGGSITMLTQGSILGIVDGNGVDVFDARYGRWVRQTTGTGPSFGVHRLTGIARDATHVYGFSMWQHGWQSMAMQGTWAATNVNSSIGFVRTSSHLYTFTATGSLSTFARFPEFSRFHALGAPLSHTNTGNPGAFCVALLSLTDTEQATPFGVLRVDPNPVALGLGFVPADGRLFSPIATPDVPALRGLNVFLQDVLLRPNGDLALTNGLSHYLW